MATDKNDFLGGFGAELFKNIKAMPTAYSVDKGDMKHNLAEMYAKNMVDYGWFDRNGVCWFVGMHEFRTSNVLAWQPLPEPFKECD